MCNSVITSELNRVTKTSVAKHPEGIQWKVLITMKPPNKNITTKFLLYMIGRTEFAPDRNGLVTGYYMDNTILLDGTSIKVYSNNDKNYNEFYLSEYVYFDGDE